MKISYAITVCDEHVELQRLISFLLRHKRRDDEIVVLVDSTKQCKAVEDYLRSHSINRELNWHKAEFTGHFADWKNRLTKLCGGDYIFQLDADEIPCTPIIESLPAILEANPETDAIAVSRVNTVEGMTQDHMQQWGWNVNAEGWINWPDYQWRIYRNNGVVQWRNRVHEVLEGFTNYSHLPMEEDYAIYHPKTIERQVRQNEYYNTL